MSTAISLYDFDAATQDISAWLKDGSGNSISSTGGAVHISDGAGSLTVDAIDLDIRNLAAATDLVSAWLKDGAGNSISSTGGAIHISDGAGSLTVDGTVELGATTLAALESITVVATDLDIRNLLFATDKVDVGGSVVELGATTLAALESITVVATDLDIRNLVFATDKVDVSGSSISFTAEVNDTVSQDVITVGATAVQLVATVPVANRRMILIENVGANSVWLGSSAVTMADGVELIKGASVSLDVSQGLYAIAAGAGRLLRILEIGLG